MSLPSSIKKKIEENLEETINEIKSISGGCIANAFSIRTKNKSLFAKYSLKEKGMFCAEAKGLKELARQRHIKIPKVICYGENFLVLELISNANPTGNFWHVFGENFAKMHKQTAKNFGFDVDNFIGATPQPNNQNSSWADFFWNQRIKHQFDLAQEKGFLSEIKPSELEKKTYSLLEQTDEPPSLLHGDLWSGNYLCDESNYAVLIDPATYYGNREADLAMTRLFGGFSEDFYESYEKEWPLPAGHKDRLPLYQLYHVINHVNLFGSSYESQALSLIANLK